jgi:hypothetical protein
MFRLSIIFSKVECPQDEDFYSEQEDFYGDNFNQDGESVTQ